MILAWNLGFSRLQKLGEDLIAMPGKGEIFSGDSAFIMRGERQRHVVITNINIRMMLVFFGSLGDPAHKRDARQEARKLEGAAKTLRLDRPFRDGFQF